MITIPLEGSFDDWRGKARDLLGQQIHFDEIEWQTEAQGFSFGHRLELRKEIFNFTIPKRFMEEAQIVSAFNDAPTWYLLYRLAYRLIFENRNLLEIQTDPDVLEFLAKVRLVYRDMHKMKAFVRFKEVKDEERIVYMAWHQPDYRIVRLIAPFFKDRFNGMNWVIMTEHETVSWDQKELVFSEGVPKEKAPQVDATEDLWKTYYRAIFNPARIKIKAMKKELPVRHWKTLPETELIDALIDESPERLQAFYDFQKPVPINETRTLTLPEIALALKSCRACGICPKATAPVMGEGPAQARMIFIGEQPGNEEDLEGKPFIGPSGQLLDRVLEEVGLNRKEIYVTNAVKGFKWLPQASQRWHRTANGSEISTCKAWLKQEVANIQPEIVVCLGRTAAQSVIGKMIKLEDVRGKFFKSVFAEKTIVIPHPASILRAEGVSQGDLYERFKAELLEIRREYEKLGA